MNQTARKNAERIVPEQYRTPDEQLLYLRHCFAYTATAALLPQGVRVLELGCGEGYGTPLLAAGRQLTALDCAPAAVARARRRAALPAVPFATGDGTRLPFAAAAFDAVVALQVIEHVADDAGFLREVRRVVRPGGQAILTTPNRATRIAPGHKPWNRFHLREYEAADLQALLQAGGGSALVRGVSATPWIVQRERSRCARAQRLAARDPLNLRRWLSPSLETAIAGILHALLRRRDAAPLPVFSADDYFLTEETADALDLFAIWRP